MKTTLPRQSEIERKWVLIDADGQPLGRMAAMDSNSLIMLGRVSSVIYKVRALCVSTCSSSLIGAASDDGIRHRT